MMIYPNRLTPIHILDKLIAAGLGDIPQEDLTVRQFCDAMAGKAVKPPRQPPAEPARAQRPKRQYVTGKPGMIRHPRRKKASH